MALRRKKHPHPKLGRAAMRDGDVIGDRMYGYHPTKGWRNRAAGGDGFNLTRFMVYHLRKA